MRRMNSKAKWWTIGANNDEKDWNGLTYKVNKKDTKWLKKFCVMHKCARDCVQHLG